LKLNLSYKELKVPYTTYSEPYAAVSILIYKEKEILFIKRSNDMPTHKGHIAFPGGKKEKVDVNIVDTAIREATEELLIDENDVEPLGILKPVDTIEFKYHVFPVVCSLKQKPDSFNEAEVQDLYFVSIDELSNQHNWRFRGIYPNDWIFKIRNETLWGATAKMTRELLGLS
jgi:8-oxo-dGTP pyrophosphatase MutT (NUDIX family)